MNRRPFLSQPRKNLAKQTQYIIPTFSLTLQRYQQYLTITSSGHFFHSALSIKMRPVPHCKSLDKSWSSKILNALKHFLPRYDFLQQKKITRLFFGVKTTENQRKSENLSLTNKKKRSSQGVFETQIPVNGVRSLTIVCQSVWPQVVYSGMLLNSSTIPSFTRFELTNSL